jgi:hypothetical protein
MKEEEASYKLNRHTCTYKNEINNSEEYMITKYIANQFVNIFKSQVSNPLIMNSTTATNVAEKLNQSNENSDIIMKVFNT